MNYQANFKTLAEAIEESRARHIAAVIKDAYSMKEAAITLGIGPEYLRRIRRRYGMAIKHKRPSGKQQIAA